MKNDEGYVLIGVIATFMVLAILSLSMISISASSFKISTSERDHQSAFYVAEAGLNYQEQKLRQGLLSIYQSDLIENQEDFENTSLGNTTLSGESIYEEFEQRNTFADLLVEQKSPYEYRITSTGHIGNESRSLSKTIMVEWQDKYEFIEETNTATAPPFAVFTSGSTTISNGTIIGDIGTTNINSNSIQFPGGGPTLNGDIYTPAGDQDIVNINVNNFNPEIKEISGDYSFPSLPDFPALPVDYTIPSDLLVKNSDGSNAAYLVKDGNLLVNHWLLENAEFTLDDNYYFQEILISGYRNLTLDSGDQDHFIIVDHLNIGNGDIYIKGKGNLTIYVTDRITLGAGSVLNKLGPNGGDKHELVNQLNIFYAGENNLTFANDVKIYGSMYVKTADIRFSGSVGVMGNIFSGGKNFEITGGSSENLAQVFFAPKAKFKITGGGALKGRIISEDFEISGGATVEFTDDLDFKEGPISPSKIGIEGNAGNNNADENKVNKFPTNKSLIIKGNPMQEMTK